MDHLAHLWGWASPALKVEREISNAGAAHVSIEGASAQPSHAFNFCKVVT